MKRRFSKDSAGTVLPFFAITVAVLVIVAALAIDAGLLYRSKLQLQRAADAGSIAGLGYRALLGWSYFNRLNPADDKPIIGQPGVNDSKVVDRAKQIVTENLSALGLSPADFRVDAQFSSVDDRIS